MQPALDKIIALACLAEIEILLIACDDTDDLVEGLYFDAVDVVRRLDVYFDECK
ncbi:MAG: hypothetical protein ACI8PP_001368 [Candidatus Pseudothioglobus sp.]|jgi:hypothetical protein